MWIFLGILTYVLFWLTCIVSYTVHYLTSTIQIQSFSQVIYTLNAGAEGAEGTIGTAVGGFFAAYWPLLILGTLIFGVYLYLCIQRRKAHKEGRKFFSSAKMGTVFNCSAAGALVLTGVLLGAKAAQGYSVLGIGEYLANVNRVSDLYETYFADPQEVTLTFPEHKRNLIYIMVESYEASFTDKEHGGGYEENLIPDLYDLAKEGTDFSPQGTSDLNGALVSANSGWTIAGLVAESAGVPLNVGNSDFCRNFQDGDAFMPALTTLGDILKAEGYHNYFMCGSDAHYAGRANYYEQHGDYEIFDVNEARRSGFVPADYSVWWGYEDLKLFEWAKEKLPEIAKNDAPFNFTMLTADTHFQDGYLCEECEDTYDSRYKNVIHCSNNQIAAFVDWCKTQDFYKDTTIVISGDHLSMDGSVPQETGADYERHVFTTIINGPEYTLDKTRTFTTIDMFPTILAALDVKIDGDRLGLGTNLFSDTPTLVETLGLAELNAELTAESKYYNEVLMSGDETKQQEQNVVAKGEDKDKDKDEETETEIVAQPTAQEYIVNQDNFSNPDYVYVPPVEQPVYDTYDPSYGSQFQYTPPAAQTPSDPGVSTPPADTTTPSNPGTTTPPADTTTPSDPGTITPPADSTNPGGNTGGSTTPPDGSGTTQPPASTTPSVPDPGTQTPAADPSGQSPAADPAQTPAANDTPAPASSGTESGAMAGSFSE